MVGVKHVCIINMITSAMNLLFLQLCLQKDHGIVYTADVQVTKKLQLLLGVSV